MTERYADAVISAVSYAEDLYHRLVLVVGPSGVGKTGVLHDVRARIGAPLLNVNLELTRSMLGLTARQRVLHLPRLLAEIVASPGSDVVLLDSVEVLFDVSLRQDPLRLLQGLSRDRTVVAAWNGEIKTVGAGQAEEPGVTSATPIGAHSLVGSLVYATPDHPEYRRYPLGDLLVVVLGAIA